MNYNDNFKNRKSSEVFLANYRRNQNTVLDFPGGAVVNPPANAGDTGSSPGLEDPTCRRATKPVHHNY